MPQNSPSHFYLSFLYFWLVMSNIYTVVGFSNGHRTIMSPLWFAERGNYRVTLRDLFKIVSGISDCKVGNDFNAGRKVGYYYYYTVRFVLYGSIQKTLYSKPKSKRINQVTHVYALCMLSSSIPPSYSFREAFHSVVLVTTLDPPLNYSRCKLKDT